MQLARAVQALTDAGVDFVIIGGVSAALLGSARVTFDLDICFSRTRHNVERLVSALAPFHPRPRGFPQGLPFLWEPATLHNVTILTLDTDLGSIDLLAEVTGLGTYEEVKAHAIGVHAFDRQIATIDLAGLLQSKRAIARDKDIETIKELESLLEASEPD